MRPDCLALRRRDSRVPGCKKYLPYDESERATLYRAFVREIKILHQLHHSNVVRFFNYYLYPDLSTGYILMEYIDGEEIDVYAGWNPEQINDLFLQVIDGFSYLEQSGVMHRDIRASNLLVTKEGQLKIIDLGFGKHVKVAQDFRKSITLNWHCDVPQEFQDERYDFATEVYFVGKLFQRIIRENEIAHFSFGESLEGMCTYSPSMRTPSFVQIQQSIRASRLNEVQFKKMK